MAEREKSVALSPAQFVKMKFHYWPPLGNKAKLLKWLHVSLVKTERRNEEWLEAALLDNHVSE